MDEPLPHCELRVDEADLQVLGEAEAQQRVALVGVDGLCSQGNDAHSSPLAHAVEHATAFGSGAAAPGSSSRPRRPARGSGRTRSRGTGQLAPRTLSPGLRPEPSKTPSAASRWPRASSVRHAWRRRSPKHSSVRPSSNGSRDQAHSSSVRLKRRLNVARREHGAGPLDRGCGVGAAEQATGAGRVPAAHERIGEVGRPADGATAGLGVVAADSLHLLEPRDRGVEAPESQLEQPERLSGERLHRPVGRRDRKAQGIGGVPAAILFVSHPGLDHGQARQPAANLVVELRPASAAKRFDRGVVRGGPVAEPELELGQGAERRRERRGARRVASPGPAVISNSSIRTAGSCDQTPGAPACGVPGGTVATPRGRGRPFRPLLLGVCVGCRRGRHAGRACPTRLPWRAGSPRRSGCRRPSGRC